ncbi:hypothetical protein HK100_010609, partial [Physocladia obscura]
MVHWKLCSSALLALASISTSISAKTLPNHQDQQILLAPLVTATEQQPARIVGVNGALFVDEFGRSRIF